MGVRDGHAAWRSQRWAPASRAAVRSSVGCAPAWSLWRREGVVWQCMCALRATAAARDGQIVRRQCCCDGSEEGGAVRCAVCAIGDLCA